MRFGHFDDRRREYVIERPDTPLPWINYLGTGSYVGLISNTGGGYSFYKDARLRRLIRYRYNNAPLDIGGRFIYIRDDTPSAQRSVPLVWSPCWQPTRVPQDSYECRHGLGYSIITSTKEEIEVSTRYFVPLDENLEIWELIFTNHRSDPAWLSVFAAVEFSLWDAQDDSSNFQRNYSIGEVEIQDGVIYHKSEYRERRDHFAYLACSEPLAGFDTQRETFLGSYRGWESPQGVEAGRLSNSIANGWQPIGAQHVKLLLNGGEQHKVVFLLGYHENPANEKFDPPGSQVINKSTVLPIIQRYLKPEQVENAFQNLQHYWDGLLGKLQVNTPDEHTNRMVNIWNACQSITTFNLSRSASYFESGIGRGMGFRDSNQDLLGIVHFIPERARQRILDLAATQLPSGGAYHQYQPLTRRGNDLVGTNFNDDPLWLVLAVSAYLKETGDWSLLQEAVPYDNQLGTDEPLEKHLERSILYTLDRLGPHGLPLIGRADWNDCLNLNCFSESPGQSFQTTANKEGLIAESVFIAGLFILAAREMQSMYGFLGKAERVSFFSNAAAGMESAVWTAGWDGDWFLRAFDDAGQPLGSHENQEGRIFIESQGMCVMAGLGLQDGRAEKALEAVAEQLATSHGILLLQPAFSRYYLHLGEISSYPPGYKENAGIFCHTNPWVMIAEAMLGHGDQAYDYYLRINPSRREAISEVHRCEPYVYAQMIAGRDASTHGEAKNSWLTGTAAWNYVAITQWILGIRPNYNGLEIAPAIPSNWMGFEVERHFRDVFYRIKVERRGPGSSVRLEVNGMPVPGNIVSIPHEGITMVDVLAVVGDTSEG